MSKPATRSARRAATAQRILHAAREEFAAYGFESGTVRGVASRASVDPSLVIQHYGSKAALFTAAIQLEANAPRAAAEHILDVLGLRIGPLPPATAALVRSMLTVPEAAQAMKAHLDERIANLARGTGGPDAELRAALTVSGILGLTIARHFLKLESLAQATDDELARAAASWLTPVIDPAIPPPPDRPAAGRSLWQFLEHCHLAPAVGGERRPVPSRPALPAPETCDPGHEVKLGRPHVAVGGRVAHQAPFGFDPVMRPRDLPHQVVEGLDPDVVGIKGEDPSDLPRGHPAELRDDHLRHEASARL